MNILVWLLYLKALVYLLQPVSSMGMWAGRLCGAQLADMVALVCEGRGYYTGETDSPLLSERQAKTFTTGGRKRTGKIVTECCHNHCDYQIIESYCAPLLEGQERWYEKDNRDVVNEENNIVEEPPPHDPQPVEDHTLVEETAPEVSQDIIETISDQLDWDDSIESETHNLLNDADLMLADEVRETSDVVEELLHKDKSIIKPGTNITETQTDETLEEETVSENSETKLSSKTKGNSRTNRPTSRERPSRRKNSREKKKNKVRSRSRENRKGRRRNKPKKNKNRHDRRKKGKKHERDDSTNPTDELSTDIQVFHPHVQVVAELPSRSEPANIDDPTDPGSRSERSFLTTITAKLLDVMGLQQQNNNRKRR